MQAEDAERSVKIIRSLLASGAVTERSDDSESA
jgi:hypothetical protein